MARLCEIFCNFFPNVFTVHLHASASIETKSQTFGTLQRHETPSRILSDVAHACHDERPLMVERRVRQKASMHYDDAVGWNAHCIRQSAKISEITSRTLARPWILGRTLFQYVQLVIANYAKCAAVSHPPQHLV